MKTLSVISTALLAALTLAGCSQGTGGEYTSTEERIVKSTAETVGGSTVVTEYAWDELTGAQTGEIQRTDGVVDYSIADFEWGYTTTGHNALSRIRTSRNAAGEEIREKLVTTYGAYYGINLQESQYDEYLLGTGESEADQKPTFRRITTWNSYSYGGPYEEVKEFKGEDLVLRQWDFNYGYTNAYTYKEQETGKAEVTKGYAIDTSTQDYERFIVEGDDEKFVFEARTDYKIEDDSTVTYTITRYDPDNRDAAPVVTKVTEEYKTFEVTITY
jgi:hypothetical protein